MIQSLSKNESDLILLEIVSEKLKQQLDLILLLISSSSNKFVKSSTKYERKRQLVCDFINNEEQKVDISNDLFRILVKIFLF